VLPESPLSDYQFGTALKETDKVEDSFFDTAVFLGDSRTEGLQLFSGLRRGTYYWARGMTVFRVDDPKYAIFEVDGEKLTDVRATFAYADLKDGKVFRRGKKSFRKVLTK
jgi:hypothetical protein